MERFPLLADHVRVCGRRFAGRHVLDSPASRARDGLGPALPRGVAGAEILKVGDSQEAGEDNKRGLLAITWGALASAAMALFGYLKVTAPRSVPPSRSARRAR